MARTKKFDPNAMCKCYFCGEHVLKVEAVERDISRRKDGSFKNFHKDCILPYEIQRAETDQWDKLYCYVRDEIWKLEPKQKLSPYLVNRLLALREGNRQVRKGDKIEVNAYPYDIILKTFIVKKFDILYAMENKTFNSENSKVDYIMTIVANEINGVYLRVKAKKEADKKLENMVKLVSENQNVETVEYVKKAPTRNKVAEKLKHLI